MALSYLDELDRLLLDQSDECMLLSQLDGFLTGVLICPELIPPSGWLPRIWSGEPGEGQPDFADMATFQRVIDLVMHHYNTILSDLNRPGTYEPLFDIDARNGDVLWEMWIEGFAEVIGATWAEVDLQKAIWAIPPDRIEAAKEHRVPLSPRAVAILEGHQPLGREYLFPGAKGASCRAWPWQCSCAA